MKDRSMVVARSKYRERQVPCITVISVSACRVYFL